jgi:hypothetical protein
LLHAQIGERDGQYLPDLPVGLARDTNTSRLSQGLQSRCDVDPIAEQIARADHHVPNVNANAEVDALVG